uniref:Response regulatory domain-containing protein n=1 Tax=Eutreptiella gymnastica TaxID=73025 RepID=A0A7S4LAN6_9EUGL
MASPAPRRLDEPDRLRWLRKAAILDTKPETEFDSVVQALQCISKFPISLVSLVDDDRQWFKANVGLDATELGRDTSFCAHVVASRKPLIVLDTHNDPLFTHNPLVTGGTKIRSYVGYPITPASAEGHCMGALCIIDTVPHSSIPKEVHKLLSLLVTVISGLIERNLQLILKEEKQYSAISTIAHELLTPMEIISQSAKLLHSVKVKGSWRREASDLINTITECSEGTACVALRDLMSLLRMQHDTEPNTEFELRGCIESAFQKISSAPTPSAVDIGYVMPFDFLVRGDNLRLRQILINLLSNALHFTHSGSVTLMCNVTDAQHMSKVQFTIEDTSSDMNIEQTWEMMKRFSGALRCNLEQHTAIGLRLAMTQHLCESMGATLYFKRTSNGSQFHFALEMEAVPLQPPKELAGKTVLLIDPSSYRRRSLKKHCESLALKTISVPEVTEGIELLGHFRATLDLHIDAVFCAAEALAACRCPDATEGDPPWVITGRHPAVDDACALDTPVMQGNLKQKLLSLLCNAPAPSSPRREPSPPGLHILCVDAQTARQRLLQSFLTRHGAVARVDLAVSGEEALALSHETSYDVIFVEALLPGIDGLVVTQVAKEQSPGTRVAVLSVFTDPTSVAECHRCGADYVLRTPLAFQEVEKVLLSAGQTAGLRVCKRGVPAEEPPTTDAACPGPSGANVDERDGLRLPAVGPRTLSGSSVGEFEALTDVGDDGDAPSGRRSPGHRLSVLIEGLREAQVLSPVACQPRPPQVPRQGMPPQPHGARLHVR